jgi:uncharacterized membrane protein YkvA (DUF1232 family)
MKARWTSRLREKASEFKRETLALYFAIRDPRTPLAARIVAGVVVAYALSPIDLVPDFIPVLGLLDDLILVPLGIALCVRLIPAQILADARVRAEGVVTRPKSYVAAAVVVLAWLAASTLFCAWFYRSFLAS